MACLLMLKTFSHIDLKYNLCAYFELMANSNYSIDAKERMFILGSELRIIQSI